jgi:hypothetical protein
MEGILVTDMVLVPGMEDILINIIDKRAAWAALLLISISI